jgi:alpha-mannosidase
MHRVDMEWLWGYGALPSSTRDMLAFGARTGAE